MNRRADGDPTSSGSLFTEVVDHAVVAPMHKFKLTASGVLFGLGLLLASRPNQTMAESGAAWTAIPLSPRLAAMGGNLTVWPRSWETPFANAAALTEAKRTAFAAADVSWIQGVEVRHVALVQPMRRASLALWGGLVNVPGIERRTSRDELIGEFAAHHVRAGVGLARRFGEELSLGLALQWFFQKIDVYEAGAVGIDLALHETGLPGGLAVGLVLRNLPITESLAQGGLELPTTVVLGLARYFHLVGRPNALLVEVNGFSSSNHETGGSLAVEAKPYRRLALRAGYSLGNELRKFSFGVGMEIRGFRLDYSYVPFQRNFGDVHGFGFAVVF